MAKRKKITQKKPDRPPKGPGTLYVVATPIGNLEDITLRALRVLKEADLIAAEDTRHTRKLLTHYGISTPTFSYYKEKEQSRSDKIIDKLLAGQDVALVSDAGTPGISDPGAILVQKAVANSIRVVPIPGPSSLTAALSVAGHAEGTFVFLGFAPARKKQRQDLLESLAKEQKNLIFFEAPHRVEKFLHDCHEILGERPVLWCRELTKIYEDLTHDTLGGLLSSCKDKKLKGESVFIIEGAPEKIPLMETEIVQLLKKYKNRDRLSMKDTVKEICNEHKQPRSLVYKLALIVWKKKGRVN
jgi:16S rRNA (cytidine1402-2'-O)-methyltransferase